MTGVRGGVGAAAVWMIGAILSFTAMGIAGRELSGEASSFEIMFWRSLLGALVVAAILSASRKGLAQLRTTQPGLHVIRHSLHFVGQNAWFIAVASSIPLAQVFALEFTSPIWVALMAPFVLGERMGRRKWLGVAVGFLGLLVVARPGLSPADWGQAAALLAAVGFAVANVLTKRLTRTDGTWTILFWMTLSQMVMALVCEFVWFGQSPAIPQGTEALWLGLIGVAGITAHFSLTSAYRAVDATVAAPMEFARLPLIAAIETAFYARALDPWVLVGGAVIFVGNYINVTAGGTASPRGGDAAHRGDGADAALQRGEKS